MSDQDLKRVDPINTRKTGGRTITEEYTFGEVFTNEVPRDFHQSGVEFKRSGDTIRWEYKGKCPILIKPDGILAKEDAPLKEAQNQAFFALSILSDHGYVSRWSKK